MPKCAGVHDAIARGLAPPVDDAYLASACIGIAQEVGHSMMMRNPPDIEGAARFTTGLILAGLAGASKKGWRR